MNEVLERNKIKENWESYKPFLRKNLYLSESLVEDALKTSKAITEGLINKFQAKKVMLFGSLVKNEMTENSDIDIAVWGIPDEIFYKAAAFATGYSSNWNVDIVDFNDCNKSVQKSILKEGIALI
ncbi:MAG: nucleotidyltransferase domain-containing protein [Candidatus Acididesulfobacter diazotrophicus]|jgi:predicted nucleotidyltransferase|uniref:Nucleotidyltransferase domain-containing protein n=1 Tax=Candidatus Acididesulfobacter diazotrophicus TaxID=2597226 RepID=A0A519BNW5_9DELT|nr:MAG: nucleotidyltransferase domain-containing protein [Candidatus Acididesulfobacter diazotrophicus]